MTPGADTADMVNPNPTSCAVLEDGDIDEPGLELPETGCLSEVQCFTLCIALSKLLAICVRKMTFERKRTAHLI